MVCLLATSSIPGGLLMTHASVFPRYRSVLGAQVSRFLLVILAADKSCHIVKSYTGLGSGVISIEHDEGTQFGLCCSHACFACAVHHEFVVKGKG